ARASPGACAASASTPRLLPKNRISLSSSTRINSLCGEGTVTLGQTTELSRVKARIKALAEKTISNGCTEAEAMAAAEMVGRLLERYALSMDEIDIREERCVQLAVPIGGLRRRPIDGCVTSIARFCDCKVWISRDTGVPSYVFF